jgi:hypothetical protein
MGTIGVAFFTPVLSLPFHYIDSGGSGAKDEEKRQFSQLIPSGKIKKTSTLDVRFC